MICRTVAIFSGTRSPPRDTREIEAAIDGLPAGSIVIHGDAPGVDRLVDKLARERGRFVVIPMPANWTEYGKAAGPIRNRQMLVVAGALARCGYVARVRAFPTKKSKGTRDLVKQARALDLEDVIEVELPA